MDIYEKMKELGVELPAAPAKGGLYSSCKKFGGNLFYVSGCGPVIDGPVTGRLGKEVTVEQGQVYARACMLNVLAALEKAVGDLRRVKSAVKITTFVQSADDFHEQPAVANGGTQLLLELWGEEAGLPSRSAIGVNALPGNIPVETEALFEVDTVSPAPLLGRSPLKKFKTLPRGRETPRRQRGTAPFAEGFVFLAPFTMRSEP